LGHIDGSRRAKLNDNVAAIAGIPNAWIVADELNAEDGVRRITLTEQLLSYSKHVAKSGGQSPSVAIIGWQTLCDHQFRLDKCNRLHVATYDAA